VSASRSTEIGWAWRELVRSNGTLPVGTLPVGALPVGALAAEVG
jgi:hypothetical protein